jgi:hypothetical protein
MIMTGKWMVFDGAFNDDGTSASSSPIWMIEMVDSIVGDSKIAKWFITMKKHFVAELRPKQFILLGVQGTTLLIKLTMSFL